MKLKYIGPSEDLSLINGKVYLCNKIEGELLRIIDEEELINYTEDEISEDINSGKCNIGYLYSILTPFSSGLSEFGVWEIVEDTNDKMLQKAIENIVSRNYS
ncbi:hypothetical protein [Clostridium cadaveris]|uniref:hypothetical protein n=1 Tax=Clostridium cadaveris TaxID=1529 RepID=UPI000C07E928|nr:hypothetical protein [Clostridium cadaveris]